MIPDEELIIYMRHIRANRLCARGARQWFNSVGLDWSHFLDHGISAAQLRETGDALVEGTIAIARAEAEASGR